MSIQSECGANSLRDMTESLRCWHFSTVPQPKRPRPTRIDFHRTKYGPEVLVDSAWIHDMPTFMRPEAHYLTFYDLLLVTRGRGWYWLDEQRYRVAPSSVLCTTPGQVRRWEVTGLDGLCLFFPAEFLEEFFSDPFFLHRLSFFHAREGTASVRIGIQRPRLQRLLIAMRRELHALRKDSEHLLRARLYEFLITLARLHARQYPADERAPNRVALRYRELVALRARREHEVAPYARELALTPNHLNAVCRRHLGLTAKGVIQERLGVEAKRLLMYSDDSVARIGFALGFEDPSYFTRFFRRQTGRSPAAFRRRHA
ncbi:MAG: AraC family transcriptional regulator [Gemmatimonadaceae bacterium]